LLKGVTHPLPVKLRQALRIAVNFQRYRLNKITENEIMLKRFAQVLALIILASYLFTDGAIAQTRRSQPRRSRSTRQQPPPKVQPVTETQRAAITQLIKDAKETELIYNYEREQFERYAGRLLIDAKKIGEGLLDRNIKAIMLDMAEAYDDAGTLYGKLMYSPRYRLSETVGGSTQIIIFIVKKYGLERATLIQAIPFILNVAIKFRELLQAMLAVAPIIPESSNTMAAPAQVINTEPPRTPEYVSISNPLIGTWSLQVTNPDYQGLSLSLTLTVNQENDALKCLMYIEGERKTCTVAANSFNLTLDKVPIEDQMYNAELSGSAEADSIKGKMTLSNTKGLSISLPLEGTRTRQ
jgi:hypothetical protein